ncbi:hypothetical protein AABB24_040051, partial [Solanum stoloniferum]
LSPLDVSSPTRRFSNGDRWSHPLPRLSFAQDQASAIFNPLENRTIDSSNLISSRNLKFDGEFVRNPFEFSHPFPPKFNPIGPLYKPSPSSFSGVGNILHWEVDKGLEIAYKGSELTKV